jgi:hypothetical protein
MGNPATTKLVASCAKRGAGVIWVQPEGRPVIGLPSSYVVNIGDGRVVMAQSFTVTNLAQSPAAQLALVHMAELATGKRKLDLPETLGNSEEH